MNPLDFTLNNVDDPHNDWRFILDFIPDTVIVHDGKVILHANRSAWRFFKCHSPEQIIGTAYLERIYPDDRDLVKLRISEVFHGRPSSLKEYRVIDFDGDVKDVEAKATMTNHHHTPCNLVILRDITERKRQQNELMALNARLRAMQERQTQLARSLINSSEQHRGNLAMELHDRIGQPLSSLKMSLERMLHESSLLNDSAHIRVEGCIEALRRSILDLKQMSSELLPRIIANLWLAHSLNSLRDEVVNRTNLDVCVFTNGLAKHYREDVEIALYRVAQEGVNNAVKHARAKRCFVNLLEDGESLSLSIEDDGVGFDVDSQSLAGNERFSLGLHIMRERIELLGGEFSIDSESGRGTNILAAIPVDITRRRNLHKEQ